MPAVSVLMPCYNAAATLSEALDSLASQTLGDFEVVAVDDGSTDATGEILSAWAAQDSRVRVLSQTHQGIITALNAGLRLCHAPYIARMDADDRAFPERLERQAAYLDAHPEIAVISSLVKAFPDKVVRQGYRIYIQWLNSLVTDEDIRREMFVESPLANPSIMMRRDWFERMRTMRPCITSISFFPASSVVLPPLAGLEIIKTLRVMNSRSILVRRCTSLMAGGMQF